MSSSTSNILKNQDQTRDMFGVIQLFVHGELKREFPLGASPLLIGRSPECDIVLADSAVSRRHAKIIAQNGGAIIKDMGTAHGIQIDGHPVTECEIQSNGTFSILQFQFKFLGAMDYKMARRKQNFRESNPIGRLESKSDNTSYSGGYYGSPGGGQPFVDRPAIFAEALGVAREQWRLITTITLGALLVGLFHVFLAVPAFETNALVQVEPKTREIGGPFIDFEGSRRVNDILVDEVEVLRSRSVLGEVVDNLGLDVKASPNYFPIVGEAIARRRSDSTTVGGSLFGLTQYAWSNESIIVDSLEIPDRFLAEPFRIVASGNRAYKVIDSDDNALARGRVGEPLSGWLPGDESSGLFVSELNANSGAVFNLQKIPRVAAIASLRDSLAVTDGGAESSIIKLSLTGSDPENILNIVDNIVTAFVMKNVEKQSEDAVRTLQFVEQQIPIAKEKMENAEARLNDLRLQKGSIDLPSDTQVVLNKIVRLESQISDLQRSRAQLIERFTPQHPRIRSLDAQLSSLSQSLTAAETGVRELPTTQREVLSVSREVAVASELYLSLVNRAQELQVVSAYAATTGNVRVVDYASMPLFPFRPNKQFLIVVYLMLGLLLSLGIILFQRQMRNVVRDPELVESRLNLPIYATLTHSPHQKTLHNKVPGSRTSILATAKPNDATIEGIRSLRTSLQFAFVNSESNVLLITGPTAGIGKTFITANLAAVLAASGRSVVVIDADLRRGTLHEQFNLSREPGLADVIGGDIDLSDVTHKTDIDGLHIISAGAIPPNPSELLMHERFVSQLQDLSAQFDHVIIDSPPVLAVTDPALISRLAGVVLLVLKAGSHPMREIEQSVKRMARVGANLKGVVFNDMPFSASSAYGYKSYQKFTKDAGAPGQSY